MFKYLYTYEKEKLNQNLIKILKVKTNTLKSVYTEFVENKLSLKDCRNLYYKMSLEEVKFKNYYINIDKEMFNFLLDKDIINTLEIPLEIDNDNVFLNVLSEYYFDVLLGDVVEKYNYEVKMAYYSDLNPYFFEIDDKDFYNISLGIKEFIDEEAKEILEDSLDEDYTEDDKESFLEDLRINFFFNTEGDALVICIKDFKFSKEAKEILNELLSDKFYESYFCSDIAEEDNDTFITIPSQTYGDFPYYLKFINILMLELYLYKNKI